MFTPVCKNCGSTRLEELPRDLITGEGVEPVPETIHRFKCTECEEVTTVEFLGAAQARHYYDYGYGESPLEADFFPRAHVTPRMPEVDPDFERKTREFWGAGVRWEYEGVRDAQEALARAGMCFHDIQQEIINLVNTLQPRINAALIFGDLTLPVEPDPATDQKEIQRQQAKLDRTQKRKALMSGSKSKLVAPRKPIKSHQRATQQPKHGRTSSR